MNSTFNEAYNDRIGKLQHELDNVGTLKDQIDSLKIEMKSASLSIAFDINKQIQRIEATVRDIESMKHFYDYLFDIIPYIKRFTTEMKTERENFRKDVPNVDSKQQNITSTSVVNVTGTKGLGTLLTEYLVNVENVKPKNYKVYKTKDDRCKYCFEEASFIIFDKIATRVCQLCGTSETYQREESNCFTFKDETENMTHLNQFAYKRSNHFLDWINSLESKMVNDIPPEVLIGMRYELKKLRIQNLEEITPKLVRTLLKKQHLNKYYEHCNAITCELSGRKPLQLPEVLKEKLKKMFNMLQEPFEIFKPRNRKNFLSYSYVIFKSLQLLNCDELLPYFSLLKSREKLQIQDQVWAKICTHLKWEFIKSI
jgi:hypothetical protein